ncbi:MAG TPA: Do family serine endopeptidase [Caulobacterales bacterium]|nr:Do family serine endopeptidase [Caulobacterales bacterium]
MSDLTPKHFNHMLAGAGVAAVLFAGFTAAPAIFSPHGADAKEIVAAPVAPPPGAPMSFANLIQRVSPAVVSIEVKQMGGGRESGGMDPDDLQNLPPGFEEFLRRMQPQQQPQKPRETTALGSGFFISEKGVIVTNNHVVEDATSIKIKTSEGKSYTAELVGTDELTDLAVLRVVKPDQSFSFVKFDTESDLRVGDWVVAVGNPFGLEGTATAGIVSAKGRKGDDVGTRSSYTDFIQIDAPINRGNSGGPTFDLQGRVVGVNSAIYSPTGGSVGIGFAIPSETAATIVDQILAGGKVTRGWIGVSVQPIDDDLARSLGMPNTKGAMVAALVPGGPAEKAGLRQGDVILKIDGAAVEDQRDLTRRVGAFGVGRTAQLEVLRDGAHRSVALKLAERPNEQQLASFDGKSNDRTPGVAPSEGVLKQSSLGADFRPATQTDRQKFNLSANAGGLVVARLDEDGPLAKKGVREGDVILSAGGQPVRTGADLAAALSNAAKAKRPILLQYAGSAGRGYIAVEPKAG